TNAIAYKYIRRPADTADSPAAKAPSDLEPRCKHQPLEADNLAPALGCRWDRNRGDAAVRDMFPALITDLPQARTLIREAVEVAKHFPPSPSVPAKFPACKLN